MQLPPCVGECPTAVLDDDTVGCPLVASLLRRA